MRVALPAPNTAPVMTWVVDTGNPPAAVPSSNPVAATWAAKPCGGSSRNTR